MIPSLENYKAWWERAVEDRDRYRDAYLAQREALRDARSVLVHIAAGHDPGHLRSSAMHVLGVVDAALSAAPLAPEQQTKEEV